MGAQVVKSALSALDEIVCFNFTVIMLHCFFFMFVVGTKVEQEKITN